MFTSAEWLDDFSLDEAWWEPASVDVRDLLAPEYQDLGDDDVDAVLRGALGEDVSLENVEDFWSTVLQALPAVLPVVGTAIGAIGGPAGMAAGGALGGLAGKAVAAATPTTPPPRTGPPPPRRRAAAAVRGRSAPSTGVAPAPTKPTVAPGVPAVPAAGQLLSVLFRPELLQALLAMTLGGAGRSDVPVGTISVPLGAFTNLISVLANQAAAQYDAAVPVGGAEIPEYVREPSGALKCDPAIPEARAEVLLRMLHETDEAWWDDDDWEGA
jgi:hypothetical protein